MQNEEAKRITDDQFAGMMANGFAEMRDQFAMLKIHTGDLDCGLVLVQDRVTRVERRIKGLTYKARG